MEQPKKYRPSNGTEGMWFDDKFCANCIHQNPNPDLKPQCMIVCNAMCYYTNEPEYPKEWIYDANNEPTCTKFKKWDWGNDGDPNDPDNPLAPISTSPNQLQMLFNCEPKLLEPLTEKIIQ